MNTKEWREEPKPIKGYYIDPDSVENGVSPINFIGCFKFNRLSRKEETRRLQHDPQQVRRVWQNTVNNARGTCLKRKSRWHVDITRHSGAQRLINFRSRFVWCRRMVRECSLGGSPPLRHRTIKFGAKYTATDRMNWNVLTQEQMATLKDHAGMGAATAVCVGIKEHFFFLPWDVWRDYESNLWTKICDWWRFTPVSCEIQWDGVIPRLYVGGCEAMSEERGLLTSQEKKAYLEHYKEADREIDRLCEELSRWRALATKVTLVLSQEPTGGRERENQIELSFCKNYRLRRANKH